MSGSGDRFARINRVLEQALDLPAEERAAFVDRACRDDDVRAEVHRLLRAHERAGEGFLSTPAVELAAPLLLETGLLDEPAMTAPTQVGPFRVVQAIGHGGMGSVFLAERADGQFEQRVALKLIRQAGAPPESVRRFLEERRILALLDHPGIARLVDGGVSADGYPWYAMELVEGEPIDRYCDARQLPIGERLDLFAGVCDAVQYAHRHLVIHRDLKPSNILVTAEGQVKLLDFGIAKMLGPVTGREAVELTRTGMFPMTPEYAAPEQVRGEQVSTATDVYALGVVLYILLTGLRPYELAGRSPADVERVVGELRPSPPSTTFQAGESARAERQELDERARARGGTPDRLRRRLQGDLDVIVMKALRKEPERRYASAEALREDLDRLHNARPVLARPDTRRYRLRKFVRRHRVPVAAAAVTLLVLVAATIFSVVQMREAELQRDAAVREKQRADAQVEFQSVLLSEIGDRPITMREIVDAGRRVLERRSAGDLRLRTALLLQLAEMYAALHDTRAREGLLVQAESLAMAGGVADRLPEIRCLMADNLRLDGRYEEAWQMLDVALALRRTATPRDPDTEVVCLTANAKLANEAGSRRGRSGEGVTAARRGLAIKDSLGETSDPSYLELLGNLARALDNADRPRESIVIYERAIAVMDSTGRGGTISQVIQRHNLALSLINLGEMAQAERILKEVVQIAERSDPSGRVPWQPAIHYAETALAQGHPEAALEYFELVAAQGVREGSLYWEGRGLFGAARARVALGRLAEARRSKARLEEIIAEHPQVRATDDQVPDGRTLDGLLALAEGATAAARKEFMAALEANGFFEGKNRSRLRAVAVLAGECALALGETREALQLAREALAIASVDSLSEVRSAHVGEARLLGARVLLASGDSNAARELASRALTALRFGAGPEHARTREAEALVRRLTG